ncbi:hypothetical protein [Dickeya zeae]
MPNTKRKLAIAHIMAHREQLLSMWAQAVIGKNPGKL